MIKNQYDSISVIYADSIPYGLKCLEIELVPEVIIDCTNQSANGGGVWVHDYINPGMEIFDL